MAATTTPSHLGNRVQRVEETRLSIGWLSLFAALAVIALLFVFQRVVHAAVDKAHANRITQSDQALALWRCSQLPRAERQACSDAATGVNRAIVLPDALVAASVQ